MNVRTPNDSLQEELALSPVVDLVPAARASPVFQELHPVATALFEYERSKMRDMQEALLIGDVPPLESIVAAFSAVGGLIEQDLRVRAGVRMTFESRTFFPERRLSPYRTWLGFIRMQLSRASEQGLLREGTRVDEASDVLVSAALGQLAIIVHEQRWSETSETLNRTAASILGLLEAA
ncbi:hypothetical protein HWD99_17430 [Microbacterium sp. C5A9]|uniref:hypothetical protein n=1 Tax=Microbacterium sp. C5A9 TaxID=2736663 RepID=UPI001F522A34|nr:hypothetical protein [Microbacterium sp. C5A9]MCI1020411.1 hypothetical protein [Microbacterium sp. C5A9]